MSIEILKKIKKELKEILDNAPSEELCSNEENDLYSNMQNLIESIENYF